MTPIEKLSREEAEFIVRDNKRTLKQEVTEVVRYPGIKLLSRFARIFGFVLALVFFIVAIISLFTGDGWGEKFMGFFTSIGASIVYFALGLFLGDMCQVLVDIEENTRNRS